MNPWYQQMTTVDKSVHNVDISLLTIIKYMQEHKILQSIM